MNKDIDIIIYGATGFTGQLCVKYFQSLETTVKWAIAGRNTEKLNKVAADNQTAVEILVADADDEFALDKLTSRAKVILSTSSSTNIRPWSFGPNLFTIPIFEVELEIAVSLSASKAKTSFKASAAKSAAPDSKLAAVPENTGETWFLIFINFKCYDFDI